MSFPAVGIFEFFASALLSNELPLGTKVATPSDPPVKIAAANCLREIDPVVLVWPERVDSAFADPDSQVSAARELGSAVPVSFGPVFRVGLVSGGPGLQGGSAVLAFRSVALASFGQAW